MRRSEVPIFRRYSGEHDDMAWQAADPTTFQQLAFLYPSSLGSQKATKREADRRRSREK
jgi:hypothetical protein